MNSYKIKKKMLNSSQWRIMCLVVTIWRGCEGLWYYMKEMRENETSKMDSGRRAGSTIFYFTIIPHFSLNSPSFPSSLFYFGHSSERAYAPRVPLVAAPLINGTCTTLISLTMDTCLSFSIYPVSVTRFPLAKRRPS